MLYCTVHALGEMAVLFPVAGSFSAYSTRFLDPAWGFAMGWVSLAPHFYGETVLTVVELCHAMACCPSVRNYCCIHYYQLLGRRET
jgi:amino acid permease